MTAWWSGLAPAQAVIACQGAEHRLRFSEGALHALDHDDIESERALAALGGDSCRCVELLDEWVRRSDDPRVLVAASRGPGDQLRIEEGVPRPGRRRPGQVPLRGGWTSYTQVTAAPKGGRSAGVGTGEGAVDLEALLMLGGGLPERLVATVVERLACDGASGAVLHAALYGRAVAAVQGWLGDARRPVALAVTGPADARAIHEGDDGTIELALPICWLGEVWARGLAIVAGCFCLAAESVDGRSFELLAVAPDLSRPVTLALDLGSPA